MRDAPRDDEASAQRAVQSLDGLLREIAAFARVGGVSYEEDEALAIGQSQPRARGVLRQRLE